jgi:hypothetical protein
MNFRFEDDFTEPMSATKCILIVLAAVLLVGGFFLLIEYLSEHQPKKLDHYGACKAMGMRYQPYEETPGYELCYGVGPDGKLQYREPFPNGE